MFDYYVVSQLAEHTWLAVHDGALIEGDFIWCGSLTLFIHEKAKTLLLTWVIRFVEERPHSFSPFGLCSPVIPTQ